MPIDHAALAAFVTEHNRRATFEGLVAELERIRERDRPAPEAVAAKHSRPWFAREIRFAIAVARLAKVKRPKEPIFVLRGARGTRQRGVSAKDFPLENSSAHDLRRTAATMKASNGVSETVIAKILNHQDRGVAKVYVRSGYDAEKKIALDQGARLFLHIVEKKDQDGVTIVAFTPRG